MEFPELTSIKRVCLDIETYDPFLKTRGPGFVYMGTHSHDVSIKDGASFVVGVAAAWRTESGRVDSLYLPWRHTKGENTNIEQSKAFFIDLDKRGVEIIGANIHYDLEGLRSDGLEFRNCQKRDIQIAEFLIKDTTNSYSLEKLTEKYLPNRKKSTEELRQHAKEFIGERADVYLNMHNLPVYIVEQYARNDAELTLEIYEQQFPILQKDGLMNAFILECDLIDYVQDVRWKGIRIDIEKAEKVYVELQLKCQECVNRLEILSGNKNFNLWAQSDIGKAADKLGLEYPRTLKDNASFSASWMAYRPEPFWQYLYQARVLDRSGSVFVKSKILDLVHNGRLYYQLTQVRGEVGGTVSARFASRNPNMQQIPSRNKEMAKKIRSLFLPEEGETWVSVDESQAEIRATVHYAKLLGLPGADECVEQYTNEPNTDYHQWVADLTNISRREAKTITFAILYGAGKAKIASELGVNEERAKEVLELYHNKLIFARPLSERCRSVAGSRGFIKTILGRKRHFDLFGPRIWTLGIKPKLYQDAIKEFGPYVQRYYIHKALNALIQGSCADIHKLSIRNLYRQKLPLCILPIHDELNFSVLYMADVHNIKDTILNSYQLKVPRQVSVKCGSNFGELS